MLFYVFLLSGSWESINFHKCWEQNLLNLESFWASSVVYAQQASRLLQDGILEPIWTQHGPKLAPSWLKLGLCWPQVGSNLALVGPMLVPDPGPQPPLSQPKPFQIPSQALQEPIQEATPRPPGLGSWILEPWKYLLDLPNPQLGPQNCSTWLQKGPSQAPNPFSPGPVVGA